MEKRLVFDSEMWQACGDLGDNSVYWRVAEILHVTPYGSCDVKFSDGRICIGHIYSATLPLENNANSTDPT